MGQIKSPSSKIDFGFKVYSYAVAMLKYKDFT